MALTNAITGLPIDREDSMYKKFADQYLDLADQGLTLEIFLEINCILSMIKMVLL